MVADPVQASVDGSVVPLYAPFVGRAELGNLTDCLSSGALIHGPWVGRFEGCIADFVGAAYGVGTNSGTTALHTALLVAGVKADEEVLLTTMTFIAPANAVRYVGAFPVFIDVEPLTWQMDPHLVRRFLRSECTVVDGHTINRSTGRRVSAIIAVHYLGMPVDLDPILEDAAASGITVIEDAAQALGTRYKSRRVGSLARIGCFSFHGNKLITAGGGGMIVTDDEGMALRSRYLINQAKDDAVETAHNAVGFNYRMTNLHGAIGCAQFDRIDKHIGAKRAIAERYADALDAVPGISMVVEQADTFYTFWLSTILVDERRFGMTARQLMVRLRDAGIESLPLYQPLHRSIAHAGAQAVGGEVADIIAASALSLPSSVGLSDDAQGRVIGAIASACAR